MWANGYRSHRQHGAGTNHFAALSTTGYVGDVLANSFTGRHQRLSIIGTSQFPAWVAPTLLNAWVNWRTFANAAWKDQYGVVHLRSSVRARAIGSDVSSCFRRHRQPRPSTDLVRGSQQQRLRVGTVNPNGSVTPLHRQQRSSALDGITFRVD